MFNILCLERQKLLYLKLKTHAHTKRIPHLCYIYFNTTKEKQYKNFKILFAFPLYSPERILVRFF